MFDMLISIIKGLFAFLKYPLYAFIIALFVFMLLVSAHMIYRYSKGDRLQSQKGFFVPQKKRSVLLRLFHDTPKQYVDDLINRKPGFFRPQGLIIYEGPQGSGKTSTMIWDTIMMQKMYPKCKCITNLKYKKEDDSLKHWKQLTSYKNGIYGVIAVLDELQNWFNSNQSRNFPPEMLEVVTQNRKNRRVLMGTAQNFYMLAKNIRTQTTEVRTCSTLLGCLTIVRRRKPIMDSDGQIVEWKMKGMYFYVHNKELRESYDTYHVINSLVKSGFKEPVPEMTNTNYVTVTTKNKNK